MNGELYQHICRISAVQAVRSYLDEGGIGLASGHDKRLLGLGLGISDDL
jgi:hypothetical protein